LCGSCVPPGAARGGGGPTGRLARSGARRCQDRALRHRKATAGWATAHQVAASRCRIHRAPPRRKTAPPRRGPRPDARVFTAAERRASLALRVPVDGWNPARRTFPSAKHDVTPHDVRDAYAVAAIRAGADLIEVSKALGHFPLRSQRPTTPTISTPSGAAPVPPSSRKHRTSQHSHHPDPPPSQAQRIERALELTYTRCPEQGTPSLFGRRR
jgi:hypothetical protein